MSSPGHLTAAELAIVDAQGSRLAVAYAPSWLSAAAELEAEFGFAPQISITKGQPIGAYRTAAEQASLPGAAGAAFSDHTKGRAVDIGNQRSFRNINETQFIGILAKHGWHNVNTQGDRFPSEPWHFANQSSSPAAAGTLITDRPRRSTMTTRYVQIGTGGPSYGKGALCALAGDVGYPCPGNFQEYVRTGGTDRASYEFEIHGSAIPIAKADWDALRRAYTEGGSSAETAPAGTLTLELKGTATPA